jgi:heme-degrading monooxygenase HmoA
MDNGEQVWRDKTDDEVIEAGESLHEYTAEGEFLIRAELHRRGLVSPAPPIGTCERCSRAIHTTDPGDACAQCGEPFSDAIRSALGAARQRDGVATPTDDDDAVVPVATFENVIEASLAKSALEAAGIEAYVPGEEVRQPSGQGMFAEVRVRQEDYAAALRVLEDAAVVDEPEHAGTQAGTLFVTVFRSRLKPEAQDEYMALAARMSELAQTMPGYVSHKGFVAPDGERVTIVEFSSEEGMRAWGSNPEHVAAKGKGRSTFYSEYRIQVCTVVRETSFPK